MERNLIEINTNNLSNTSLQPLGENTPQGSVSFTQTPIDDTLVEDLVTNLPDDLQLVDAVDDILVEDLVTNLPDGLQLVDAVDVDENSVEDSIASSGNDFVDVVDENFVEDSLTGSGNDFVDVVDENSVEDSLTGSLNDFVDVGNGNAQARFTNVLNNLRFMQRNMGAFFADQAAEVPLGNHAEDTPVQPLVPQTAADENRTRLLITRAVRAITQSIYMASLRETSVESVPINWPEVLERLQALIMSLVNQLSTECNIVLNFADRDGTGFNLISSLLQKYFPTGAVVVGDLIELQQTFFLITSIGVLYVTGRRIHRALSRVQNVNDLNVLAAESTDSEEANEIPNQVVPNQNWLYRPAVQRFLQFHLPVIGFFLCQDSSISLIDQIDEIVRNFFG